MNAADVLEKAAGLIERTGWFGGKQTPDGCVQIFGHDPHCALLAINKIANDSDGDSTWNPAHSALAEMLSGNGYAGGIVEWNNAPPRTAAEVTSTMRACAAVLRAKESALIATPAREPISA